MGERASDDEPLVFYEETEESRQTHEEGTRRLTEAFNAALNAGTALFKEGTDEDGNVWNVLRLPEGWIVYPSEPLPDPAEEANDE